VDSDELGAIRRSELDVSREYAAALGVSAGRAIEEGHYFAEEGQRVDWSEAIRSARVAKRSIAPGDSLPENARPPIVETRITVSNETTLGAGHRLTTAGFRPLALNFANGVSPGGGFLGGARAQEEVLCRSSGLYATLRGDHMYDVHRRQESDDSSDWAILSPDVPVFRSDAGTTLGSPWPLSFITCAAPYAPSVGQPRSGDLLQARIHRVFQIARAYGYKTLVLGAWGCGAFANDPGRTARDFRAALQSQFEGSFDQVVFAIADWSRDRRFLGPFRDVFVGGLS